MSSVLSPFLSSVSSTMDPLGIIFTTGLTPRLREPTESLLPPRLQLIRFSGAQSLCVFSSPTLDLSTEIASVLLETRSRMICSVLCRDHGRFGLLYTPSTLSSSPPSTVWSSSTLFRLHSTCSFLFLDQSKFCKYFLR